MKWNSVVAIVAVVCLALVVVSTGGCKTGAAKTAGAVVANPTCDVCPSCNMKTSSVDIKSVTCVKGVCPCCKTVTTINTALAYAVRNYVGDEVGEKVHVCDHCKAIVEKCPACRKMAKK